MGNKITINSLILLSFGLVLASTPDLMYAQDTGHTVSGSITSAEDGEPLAGVNIAVRGTTIGTSSNAEGKYSLEIPSQTETLVFSFIGYQTQETTVDGRTTINVSLIPQAIVGDELVVIGYGAVQRSDVTGAVSSISSRDIREVPVTSLTEALQARAAGVLVVPGGNRPGQIGSIRIRGNRSLTASNDPLFVVDGVPVSDIADVAPGDIESIEVLKDASAAAIYGSRGANGVILVTTQRGGNHQTQVSYSGQAGIVRAWSRPDMMNASQYMQMRCDGMAYANQFLDQDYGDPNCAALGTPVTGGSESRTSDDEWAAFNSGVDTNWMDLLVADEGFQQDHTLSIRGGNESTQFALSGNFFFDQGVVEIHDFQRSTFRLNLDHSVNERLRVGTSTSLTRSVQNLGTNMWGSALAGSPLLNPYEDDGSLRVQLDPLVYNPLLDLAPNAVVDERTISRILGNVYAEYNILDNLTYRLSFAPDIQTRRIGQFFSSMSTVRQTGEPQGRKQHRDRYTYTLGHQVNYDETLGDIHSIRLTGVMEVIGFRQEVTDLNSRNMPYEGQIFHNLETADNIQNYGSNLQEWGLVGYMGRAVYTLMDKYSLTFTGRYDGSSRLAEGNRFAFFPSASVMWRIVEEPFLTDQSLLSDLRLRVSYGRTGNQAIAPYQTRGSLARTTYSFDDQSAFGFRPGSIANPELRWETSTTLNLGLDFGLLDDRVVGSVEVYEVNTTDLLLNRQLPNSSGFGSITTNLGATRNRGWEVTLQSRNVATQNFNWTSDLNIYANREEIVEIFGDGRDDVGNQWFIGQPLFVHFDYEFGGIWQLDEADEAETFGARPGEIKVVDQDGSGSIDGDDRVILGGISPRFNIGFSNRFSYKGLDLSVFMFARTGNLLNYNHNNTLQGRYNNRVVDYWTADNPSNSVPAVNLLRESPLYGGTVAYEKGDFLKIRNIQLGYRLPASLVYSLGLRSVRLHANVDTPLILHRLPVRDLDPERVPLSPSDPGTPGFLQVGDLPTTRSYQFGINIQF